MPAHKKLALVSNTAWSVWNFRKGLIIALLQAGWQVDVLAPPGPFTAQIERLGCRFLPLRHLAPKGKKFYQDLLLIRELYDYYRRGNYRWILSYTIKPNLYTGLALRWSCACWLPTVNGLGVVFLQKNLLSRLAAGLYRWSFRSAQRVVFQNADDRRFFEENGLVSPEKAIQVAGSGIDLSAFRPLPGKQFDRAPVFLFAGRLIAEKGVREYIEAARKLQSMCPDARCLLSGLPAENPRAVTWAALEAHLEGSGVGLLVPTDDMAGLLDTVDCVVLPSYYGEGVPRILLEALAKGLPLITSDMPGCKDTVEPGRNGWLVPPRDTDALFRAMFAFCQMSPQLRAAMGREGRSKAQHTFDEQLIIQKYLDILDS
ncbi:MAG: glycosyltransferase family 4 protein [Saprospiraceae bacterium]